MRKTSLQLWLEANYRTQAAREFIARAYRRAFSPGSEAGQAVLADLAKACFIMDTTATRRGNAPIDQIEMNIQEGRRQAYMHIAAMLSLTSSDTTTKGPVDHDHRDERREPEPGTGERDGYTPRWGAGYDPELDGPPIGEPASSGSEPASSDDAGS